jgi:hypothetical protein
MMTRTAMARNGAPQLPELYSGLRFLREERALTLDTLARRIADLGSSIDSRTLQRLDDPDRPIKQVDARVVALLCDALHIEIGGLLAITPPHSARLDWLAEEDQDRLDDLLDQQRAETLTPGELDELRALVERAGQQSVRNAQRLVEHRHHLREAILAHQQRAAD